MGALTGARGDFAGAARRLAGLAGVAFGWSPELFWRSTPDELATLVSAAVGEGDGGGSGPPDPATMARMREAFPDG